MSIENDPDLERAQLAVAALERTIASLRRETAGMKPHAFSLLADGPLHEIEKIRAEIDEYTGATAAVAGGVAVWLRLSGSQARWREASASVVAGFIDALRKGVQAIAVFDSTGRTSGRPSAPLLRACDPELVAFAPGSFQVGMNLPEPIQASLEPDVAWQFARKGLKDLMIGADWAASPSAPEDLADKFTDLRRRRLILRAVKSLVPKSGGGIDLVEFKGRALPNRNKIQLVHASGRKISDALRLAVAVNEESYEGNVREIDLDRKTLHLRGVPGAGAVVCRFDERLRQTAAASLDKRVRVIGTRATSPDTPRGFLSLSEIEPIDADADE